MDKTDYILSMALQCTVSPTCGECSAHALVDIPDNYLMSLLNRSIFVYGSVSDNNDINSA